MSRKKPPSTIVRALEEVRYGPNGLLNLRDSMPTETEAVTRAEAWLRERQVMGIAEVVIITGRGSGSPGGIAVIREGVRKVLNSLKRRGVVDKFNENGPGSFLVSVAPLKRLFEAPRRRRESSSRRESSTVVAGLSSEAQSELRLLALASLRSLGVAESVNLLESEMARQFSLIVASLPEGTNRDSVLTEALRRARQEYEDAPH